MASLPSNSPELYVFSFEKKLYSEDLEKSSSFGGALPPKPKRKPRIEQEKSHKRKEKIFSQRNKHTEECQIFFRQNSAYKKRKDLIDCRPKFPFCFKLT